METNELKKILIVDDNRIVTRALKSILTPIVQNRAEIQTAECLEDALDLINNYNTDLVLIDTFLPDGDYLTSLKSLRKNYNGPLYLMSVIPSEDQEYIKSKSREFNVSEFFLSGMDEETDGIKTAIFNFLA